MSSNFLPFLVVFEINWNWAISFTFFFQSSFVYVFSLSPVLWFGFLGCSSGLFQTNPNPNPKSESQIPNASRPMMLLFSLYLALQFSRLSSCRGIARRQPGAPYPPLSWWEAAGLAILGHLFFFFAAVYEVFRGHFFWWALAKVGFWGCREANLWQSLPDFGFFLGTE